jgi:DNA-binding NtrC family response regulator
MPVAIQDHMRDHGLFPIVRDDLVARIVRRPDLRELLQALDLHDALVALPLVSEGQLEGVLVVARGERSERLTLEELAALEGLCGEIAGHMVVLLAAERSHARAQAAAGKEQRALGRIEDLQLELASARDRAEVLVRGLTAIESAAPVIAYSADMRQLVARLTQIAPHDVPVFLAAEPGDAILPLARLLHEHSGRAKGPFVAADLLSIEQGRHFEALVGARGLGQDRPGFLEMAEGGTLVLCDIAALPHGGQHVLVELLSERRVRAGAGRSARAANVRLVCTARCSKAELVAVGAMLPELARWLEPTSLQVPPLRERREDLESLVLLAIDRASRALGKPALGISPDALAALSTHSFPGNAIELESVVQRAVSRAGAQRVQVTDLPALTGSANAFLGSFVDQEREILRQALERAGGNKTRAAAALGLKRTTLIDKLKRHGLDDSPEPIQH